MKNRRALPLWTRCMTALLGVALLMTGRAGSAQEQTSSHEETLIPVTPTSQIVELEPGLLAVRFDGDDGLADFLAQGGAASDAEAVQFIASRFLNDLNPFDLLGGIFGCSTVAVTSPEGDALFGRNFDWQACEAMVVASYPEEGYASISTVNMDFITRSAGGAVGMALSLDSVRTLAALYAPLDGMNEAGLAVSVNMIADGARIEQDTGKPGLTTTTAIRLLLDRAANVEEALALLAQHDLHGSMGMMVHFAIADATGRSVAVEYVNDEMIVTETPVLTNFYLAEGEKQGIGTAQSHERYAMLMARLDESSRMTMEGVRDALNSVSKDNFGEFESTEWSVVMNLTDGEAVYYHREDYGQGYAFRLER